MKKIFFAIVFLSVSFAHASTGYIDTSNTNTAKVCYDPTCANPVPSTINFELFQQPSIVVDSVTGLSGYVWGSALGWINMQPIGGGVTFANPATGVLTGKAWSQVSGWINFGVTGQQISINPTTGEFSGFGWTGGPNGGWIKFDCNNSDTCVKTTWRAPVFNNGGHPVQVGHTDFDVCKNIQGTQASIPSGYTVAADGSCVTLTDSCPNLSGEQSEVPKGFVKDIIGACIPLLDHCPNITGIQPSIPPYMMLDIKGDCIPAQKNEYSDKDVCSNISGIQSKVPKGYSIEGDTCYMVALDMCPNIEGSQKNIPEGFVVDTSGACVQALKDVCPNLSGSQESVPKGFHLERDLCLFNAASDVIYENTPEIVGYSFVPEALRIRTSNIILRKIFHAILHIDGDFAVDLTSVGATVVIVPSFLFFIIRYIRKIL